MPLVLTETDTVQDCAFAAWCAGGTNNASTSAKRATSGGTAGVTAVSLTQDAAAATRNTINFQSVSGEPNSTSWEAGTWVVRLEVTTANMSLTWSDLSTICRINNACVSQATIGSGSAIQPLDTTGVKTMNFTGSASNANALDEIGIVIVVFNSATMTQAWAYKPSQNIDTPVTQGGPVVVAEQILAPILSTVPEWWNQSRSFT